MIDEVKPYTPVVQSEEELAADRQEALDQMIEEGVFPQEQVGPLVAQVSASLDGLRAQVAQLVADSHDYKVRLLQLEVAMALREFFYFIRQLAPVTTLETLAMNAPTVLEMTVPIVVEGLYKVTLNYNWNSSLSSVYCISWLEVENVMQGIIHRQKSQQEGGEDEEYLMQRSYYLNLTPGFNRIRYRVMTGHDPDFDSQPGDRIEASIENATMELVKAGVA
jgi:hypothetical protein